MGLIRGKAKRVWGKKMLYYRCDEGKRKREGRLRPSGRPILDQTLKGEKRMSFDMFCKPETNSEKGGKKKRRAVSWFIFTRE